MKQYFEDSVNLGASKFDTAPIREAQLQGLPIGSAVLVRKPFGDYYQVITIKAQKPILIPAPHAGKLLDDAPILVMNDLLQRRFKVFYAMTINSGIVKIHAL